MECTAASAAEAPSSAAARTEFVFMVTAVDYSQQCLIDMKDEVVEGG